MKQCEDFLVELGTEELPPKALFYLAQAFCEQMKARLEKTSLGFEAVTFLATPRRLAVLVSKLAFAQPDQVIERKGPALNLAFDADGKPTPACVGFARSCQVSPHALQTMKNAQVEWVCHLQQVPGQSVMALLPVMVNEAAMALPIPKRMRWGAGEAQFARPVQTVVLLYGDQVIPGSLFGVESGRMTHGHRFHAPRKVAITHASLYASLLETEGHVIAYFAKRRHLIRQQAATCVATVLGEHGKVLISSEALLDEVTGLVEWPVAICGTFEAAFLSLPREVLISSMQDHQRYFPVVDVKTNKLLPYFVAISNIESKQMAKVVHGNERVLRARLSDADFFYKSDRKTALSARVPALKEIVYQAKLGTLHEKVERVSQLAQWMAQKTGQDALLAKRAAALCKADLTTSMVGEFPELQGVMGGYYALNEGEPAEVALAIKEHYLPRFAGDQLPASVTGQLVSLADRMDTVVGAFGVNQQPTGDKDPYGLRRAALGALRILIEGKLDLDLSELLAVAVSHYGARLENAETVSEVLMFMRDRLRAWYQDQGITPDVFAAVAALEISNPLDMHQRIKAVQACKKMNEAEALSAANKRVSHILAKYVEVIEAKKIDPALFEHAAEEELLRQLEAKHASVPGLCQRGKYDEVLMQLAELRQPVDDFFDHVMVMTDDKSRRENRMLLLKKLRNLFLQVADIAYFSDSR